MPEEFEELVELHYSSLYRFAMSLTHQESEACDLTQQTFQVWAEKAAQMRDRSKAKSWLFTTLHRLFLAKHRRSARFPEVDIESLPEELPDTPANAEYEMDVHVILRALQQLDPNFRAAVALFYLEEHTHPEIAAILDVPLGTVKSRISRGIAQMQGIVLPEGAAKTTKAQS